MFLAFDILISYTPDRFIGLRYFLQIDFYYIIFCLDQTERCSYDDSLGITLVTFIYRYLSLHISHAQTFWLC